MHLLNAHGLDEAGIDGGGIFREFLNELLKSGFNPNQGFFKTTNEGLLYPNPAARMLVGDSFARHYYFLGRMLGKVMASSGGGPASVGGGLCARTAPSPHFAGALGSRGPGSGAPQGHCLCPDASRAQRPGPGGRLGAHRAGTPTAACADTSQG